MEKQIGLARALLFVSLLLFISACVPSGVVNDFFGIQMNPSEQDQFKIVSYSEAKGANFFSTPDMNPRVVAWANFLDGTVQLKVVNNSALPISYQWEKDLFTVTLTDGREVALEKGIRAEYPNYSPIKPGKSQSFFLKFPKFFWNTVSQNSGADVVTDFWRGNNSTYLLKDDIRKIYVNLNGETELILKPVPKKRNTHA